MGMRENGGGSVKIKRGRTNRPADLSSGTSSSLSAADIDKLPPLLTPWTLDPFQMFFVCLTNSAGDLCRRDDRALRFEGFVPPPAFPGIYFYFVSFISDCLVFHFFRSKFRESRAPTLIESINVRRCRISRENTREKKKKVMHSKATQTPFKCVAEEKWHLIFVCCSSQFS